MNVASQRVTAELMRLRLLSEGLDELLGRLATGGVIGGVKPAGAARMGMLGVGLAMRDGDVLFGTRRDLSAALGRGLSPEAVLQQALGREGDPALGRGMPGAIQSAERGVVLTDGNVASHAMHAAGFGHAARARGGATVAVALFGSAAQANGELHGAFNFAAVYKAQTVFVARGLLAGELPYAEAEDAWGLPVVDVDGHDGLAVHDAVQAARAQALSGGGPTLIDARVEHAALVPVDAARLQLDGGWSADVQSAVRAEVQESIRAARAAAEAAAAIPDETMFEAVFSDRPWFL